MEVSVWWVLVAAWFGFAAGMAVFAILSLGAERRVSIGPVPVQANEALDGSTSMG